MDLAPYLEERKRLVDGALKRLLPPSGAGPATLREAMRYSVFAGGKRLRPVLCVAVLETLGADPSPFLPAACALELVHTYSLVHDDLPAMDDDDLRRGRPTSHRVFGEAMAILAGDALLTMAFEVVARMDAASAAVRAALVAALARGIGGEGMVGGQALDIGAEGRGVTAGELAEIHARKTAALMETSAAFGALLGGADQKREESLRTYGRSLGMAFQVTDDILDATGDEQAMGKQLRQDAAARKATYPALFGLEESRRIAAGHVEAAVVALRAFDERAWPLRELARRLIGREK